VKLPDMPLKKRVLIAVIAIAVIHALFVFVPRWWATRPRFDEAAWREAVEILKADVGAAAVEKGTFGIPRIKVKPPYRKVVEIGKHLCMLVDGAGASLVYVGTARGESESSGRVERLTAKIGRKKVDGILGALEYTRRINVLSNPEYRAFLPVPLSRYLGWRYEEAIVRRALEDNEIKWSDDKAEFMRMLLVSFRRCIVPSTNDEVNWAGVAAGEIAANDLDGVAVVAKALGRVELAQRIAKSKFAPGFLKRETRLYSLDRTAAELSHYVDMAGTIAGKTEEERVKKAAESAFDTVLDPKRRYYARDFLVERRPEEFVELYLAKQDALPTSERVFLLTFYDSYFGADRRVAEAGTSDPSPVIRSMAHLQMYKMTKDMADIEKLKELLLIPENQGGAAGVAARMLCLAYTKFDGPREIPDFLEEHFEAAPWSAVEAAKVRGSAKDLDLLVLMTVDAARTRFVSDKEDALLLRELAARRLRGISREDVIERLIGYASGETPEEELGVKMEVIGVLGASGSSKALSFLDGFRRKEEEGARGNRGQAPANRRYEGYAHEYTPMAQVARRAHVEAAARCSASPVDFLSNLSEEYMAILAEIDSARLPNPERKDKVAEILADSYTVEQLQGMLADEKYGGLFGHIYAAIEEKR